MNMQIGNHQLKGSCVPSEGKFYCRKIFKKIGATPKEILPVAKVYREAFKLACQENGTVSPLKDYYSRSFYRLSTQIGKCLGSPRPEHIERINGDHILPKSYSSALKLAGPSATSRMFFAGPLSDNENIARYSSRDRPKGTT